MRSTLSPSSALRDSSRSRIWACMVTSSAVVGSSAMRSRDCSTARWPSRPAAPCRRRTGRGSRTMRLSALAMPTRSSSPTAPAGPPHARELMGADGLGELVADAEHRVEAVLRVLEDEADLRSPDRLQHLGRGRDEIMSRESHGAAGDRPVRRARDRPPSHGRHRLARSTLPDDPQGLAGDDLEGHVSTRVTDWSLSRQRSRDPPRCRTGGSSATSAAELGAAEPDSCLRPGQQAPDVAAPSASRNASAMTFNAVASTVMTKPGIRTSRTVGVDLLNPVCIIAPRLVWGGWEPRPKKAECALGDEGEAEGQAELHDERGKDRRDDVPSDDPVRWNPGDLRSRHEPALDAPRAPLPGRVGRTRRRRRLPMRSWPGRGPAPKTPIRAMMRRRPGNDSSASMHRPTPSRAATCIAADHADEGCRAPRRVWRRTRLRRPTTAWRRAVG